MKTLSTLLLTILFLSTTLFSQTNQIKIDDNYNSSIEEILEDLNYKDISKLPNGDYYEYNSKNLIDDILWVNDSFYRYQGNNKLWNNLYRFFVLNRNEKGSMTEGVGQAYFNKKWENYKKYIYSYDSEFKDKDHLTFVWNSKDQKWGDTLTYRKYLGKNLLVDMSRNYSYNQNLFINGDKKFYEYNDEDQKVFKLKQKWSFSDQRWENNSMDSTEYIDSRNWILSEFNWNEDDDKWIKYSAYYFEKDNDDNNIYLLKKKRIDSLDLLVNSFQIFSSYNKSHKNTSYLWQFWNNKTKDWVNFTKITNSYIYGVFNTENSKFNWNIDDSLWIKDKKNINTFNSDSTRNTEITQYGRSNDTLWHNSTKNIYFYKLDTFIVLRQEWDSDSSLWINSTKYISFDNDLGKNDSIIQFRWDKNNNRWNNYSATRLSYDSFGNLIEITYQSWKNDNWVANRKTLYKYNNNNLGIENTSLRWDYTNEKWIKRSQFIYDYDESGNRTLYLKRKGDYTGDEWDNVEKFILYWSAFEIDEIKEVENTISVFPNPTSDYLYLGLSQTMKDKEVSIYSINGNLVLKKSVYGNQLDISSLRNGFYSLKIVLNGKIYTSKFIVE